MGRNTSLFVLCKRSRKVKYPLPTNVYVDGYMKWVCVCVWKFKMTWEREHYFLIRWGRGLQCSMETTFHLKKAKMWRVWLWRGISFLRNRGCRLQFMGLGIVVAHGADQTQLVWILGLRSTIWNTKPTTRERERKTLDTRVRLHR